MIDTENLAYPIGRWSRPDSLDANEQARAVERLAAQAAALRTAVEWLDDEQLDTEYRPGGWTVRQLVHHIPDSHLNMYVRLKLALTEDTPTIKPYDQEAWAGLADVDAVPVDVSLSLFDAVQRRAVAVLQGTSAADRKRMLMHPESGPMSVEQLMSLYAWHGDHHIAHITALSAREGWL